MFLLLTTVAVIDISFKLRTSIAFLPCGVIIELRCKALEVNWMKYLKPPVQVKILTGKEAEVVREQRFQAACVRLAARIEEANFSEEEILAEVQAFRAGK